MVLKMFSIYDRKSEMHHPPFYAHTVGHALRTCTDMFTEVKMFANYPADFQLFEVGSFDDASAEIKGIKPYLICSGTELVDSIAREPDANNSKA